MKLVHSANLLLLTIALGSTPSNAAQDIDIDLLAATYVLAADIAASDGTTTWLEDGIISEHFSGPRGYPVGLVTKQKMFSMSLKQAEKVWANSNVETKKLLFPFLVKVAGTDEPTTPKELALLKKHSKGLGPDFDPTNMAKAESLTKMRSEISRNIQGIKSVMMAYEANFDVYVDAELYPPSPGTEPRAWDTAKAGGFSTIGWSPDGEVRGSYSIESEYPNFTVYGISDIDGDGNHATYTATKSTRPTLITDEKVY
jgi:hypothetical protein